MQVQVPGQGVFKRVFKGDLDIGGGPEGELKGDLEGDLEVDLEGDFRGDFKQDLEGDLLSSSGQLRSRSGLVQVWFSLQPKFNSFELDSDVNSVLSESEFTQMSRCQHFLFGIGLSLGFYTCFTGIFLEDDVSRLSRFEILMNISSSSESGR